MAPIPAYSVPSVAVAGGSHRVHRVNLPGALPQRGNQQAATGLDGHRDRRLRGVPALGQKVQQQLVAVQVVVDPALGQQLAGVIDERDVVV
ncbi:hypothetical protein GCM10015535_67660 [Streptomyces gelaticus]|uniref:Uncharacterized protein n=1 Tax=Streptomyces gelaticus TaxID=285446 RepID=A0ABQ2W8R9_9ACTN|nr:hypothetical protein GCM10015535_67660 [Streptomyces gelaticus]